MRGDQVEEARRHRQAGRQARRIEFNKFFKDRAIELNS